MWYEFFSNSNSFRYWQYRNGLVQDCNIYVGNELQNMQSCTKSAIWWHSYLKRYLINGFWFGMQIDSRKYGTCIVIKYLSAANIIDLCSFEQVHQEIFHHCILHWSKTLVSPLLMHWSYCNLVPIHYCGISIVNKLEILPFFADPRLQYLLW